MGVCVCVMVYVCVMVCVMVTVCVRVMLRARDKVCVRLRVHGVWV